MAWKLAHAAPGARTPSAMLARRHIASSTHRGSPPGQRRCCQSFISRGAQQQQPWQRAPLLRVRAQQQPQQTGADVRTASPPPRSASPTGGPEVPPGCARYTVTLTKPMGLVLEQDTKSGLIKVAEIRADGSAARSGQIQVGDQLIATSGVTYSRTEDYGGAAVRGGQQIVRLVVAGETMKTVSAAIGSHPGHIPVTLEFQRCE